MASSTNQTEAIAALSSKIDRVLEFLTKIIGQGTTTIAQGQENNRALASLCDGMASNWHHSFCSSGKPLAPPSMLFLVLAVVAVVALVQVRRQ